MLSTKTETKDTHSPVFNNLVHEIAFEVKDGRLLAKDEDVAYILPSDQIEVERLRLNHNLWKLMIGDLHKSPIHDRLVKGIRVLDIGCGPGWWILDMARLYPKSEFVGIDMADVFAIKRAPLNVSFKIMNAGTGLDFEDESFDFVFQRFLVMGFPTDQYLRSIREMKRILRPDGTIEILELINSYNGASAAFKNVGTWIDQALSARNMDSYIADKIPGFLFDAGYENIKSIDYNIPIGPLGGLCGMKFLAVQKMALPAVKPMVTLLTKVTAEEYDSNLEEAFKEVETLDISTRFKLIYADKQKQ